MGTTDNHQHNAFIAGAWAAVGVLSALLVLLSVLRKVLEQSYIDIAGGDFDDLDRLLDQFLWAITGLIVLVIVTLVTYAAVSWFRGRHDRTHEE